MGQRGGPAMSNWRDRPGSTRASRKIREHILAANRANNRGRCRLQLPDVCTTIATTVHHTLGWHVTGDNPAHMVASCAPCNLKTGDPRRHDPAPRPRKQW